MAGFCIPAVAFVSNRSQAAPTGSKLAALTLGAVELRGETVSFLDLDRLLEAAVGVGA